MKNLKRKFSLLMIILFTITLCPISDYKIYAATLSKSKVITQVSLSETKSTLAVGDIEELMATVYPSKTASQIVKWTSSNPKVATVSSVERESSSGNKYNAGKVKALSKGTTIITAIAADGSKKATCTITVIPSVAVKSIKLNESSTTLAVGAYEYLQSAIYPDDATDQEIQWTTSNSKVATVSSNGKIMALSPGKAIIKATTSNKKTASCVVTVTKATAVILNKSTITLAAGEYDYLSAKVYPNNGVNRNVKWTSSNPSVATVSSRGEVSGVRAGVTTITATTADGNKKATCTIKVTSPISVTSVALNQTNKTLTVGSYDSLFATVYPITATNKKVKWTSSNPSVVSVSSEGNINALSIGKATITATTENGSKKANCVVTVTAPVKVKSVALNKIKDTLTVGGYTYLDANISPSNATNQNVQWVSSNPAVVTVTSYGSVTAVSAGKATITAITEDGNKKSSCVITVKAPVKVTSISINQVSPTLTVGDYTYLSATVKPSNAANKNVKWTSSNPAIATVTSYGEVTAVSAGTATITATTEDGNKKASCIVKVKAPIKVTSVALNKIKDTLKVGGYTHLNANISPINANNQNVEWTSSNPAVATVTSYGEVTAVSAGTATITATTEDGNKKSSCVITVKAPVAVTSVSLSQFSSTLTVGDYTYLEATVKPSNAENKNVKWISSNPAVATVTSYGEVKAVGAGTATITAITTDGNKKSSCVITVKAPIAVTSVGLNKITNILTVGDYDYLSATVYPSNAANKEIEWTSSNSAVATVSSNGKVTAVGAGTATITVTTADGSKTKTCTIKVVSPIAVTSIVLNKTKTTLKVGNYEYLEAIINPTNAANKDVEWTSSNLDVAVVNYYGEVIAVGKGTATITATTSDGNKKASCVVTVN